MSASADASSASEIMPLSCSRRSEVHSGPLGTAGVAAGAAVGAGVDGGGCVVTPGGGLPGAGAGGPEASGAGAGCAGATCGAARKANVATVSRTRVVMYSSCLQQGCAAASEPSCSLADRPGTADAKASSRLLTERLPAHGGLDAAE